MSDDSAKQNDAGLVPVTRVRIEALAEQVEQELDPLARRQLALRVLGVDPSLAPSETRLSPALFQLFNYLQHALSSPIPSSPCPS